METLQEALGQRIRNRRKQLGLSQRDLAGQVETAATNLNHYEKGTRNTPLELVVKLATTLGVTTDFLLGASEESQQFFVDAETAEAFRGYRELSPRDRQVVIDFIGILRRR